jgi:hypothetical protein
MDSKIPWEQLSFDTLKPLCQELGLDKPQLSPSQQGGFDRLHEVSQ